jgi:hypothetical protein
VANDPAVFRTATRHRRCDLRTLEAVYSVAEDGAVAARERASDAERVVPLARSLELSVSNLPDNRVQMVVDTD